MRRWLSVFIVMFWSASALAAETSPLLVDTPNGVRSFEVELVNTPASRARGLMHVEHMPDGKGMLFDFREDRMVSFWMKNTLIPLDMIFTDRDGVILQIHHNAIPHDETAIPSNEPIRAVLEINGGLARFLGIREGQILRHRIFNNL